MPIGFERSEEMNHRDTEAQRKRKEHHRESAKERKSERAKARKREKEGERRGSTRLSFRVFALSRFRDRSCLFVFSVPWCLWFSSERSFPAAICERVDREGGSGILGTLAR
jgi:hypothetical protein